jgi:hypothetical protein
MAVFTVVASRFPSTYTKDTNSLRISSMLALLSEKLGFCENHVEAQTINEPLSLCFVDIPIVKRMC